MIGTTNEKSHRANGGPFENADAQPQFNAKSTATEAQRTRVLDALKQRAQTTEDLRKLGSFQCAVRIMELRAQGYNISTTRVTLVDRAGFTHARSALYTLEFIQGGVSC